MLTLTQLYNLGKSQNVDIFDGLTLPNGSPMDRETLINTIMVQCGLNIPMYADPFVFKSAVNIWSAKNQYTFEHIAKIYLADYSPIENTDRYDSVTVERDRRMDDTTTSQNKTNEELSTKNNTTHSGTDTNTIEETTSAMNANDYQPDTKTVSDMNHGEKIDTNGSSDKTIKASGTNIKGVDEAEKTTTTQHLHGNIGTTTNTMLQSEEYALLKDYNPYTFISGLFENELTLCVY